MDDESGFSQALNFLRRPTRRHFPQQKALGNDIKNRQVGDHRFHTFNGSQGKGAGAHDFGYALF